LNENVARSALESFSIDAISVARHLLRSFIRKYLLKERNIFLDDIIFL